MANNTHNSRYVKSGCGLGTMAILLACLLATSVQADVLRMTEDQWRNTVMNAEENSDGYYGVTQMVGLVRYIPGMGGLCIQDHNKTLSSPNSLSMSLHSEWMALDTHNTLDQDGISFQLLEGFFSQTLYYDGELETIPLWNTLAFRFSYAYAEEILDALKIEGAASEVVGIEGNWLVFHGESIWDMDSSIFLDFLQGWRIKLSLKCGV